MLEFSIIHPMPNGDIFHLSSHHSKELAGAARLRIEQRFRAHPEKFDSWFQPNLLEIRDNRGTIINRMKEFLRK